MKTVEIPLQHLRYSRSDGWQDLGTENRTLAEPTHLIRHISTERILVVPISLRSRFKIGDILATRDGLRYKIIPGRRTLARVQNSSITLIPLTSHTGRLEPPLNSERDW